MNKDKRVVRHVSLYAVSGILGRLVGFLMLPIYTQYLTPADYGVIALITVVISVLEGTLGVRLVQAVAKFYFDKPDKRSRHLVLSTAVIVSAAAGGIVCILLLILSENVSTILFASSDYSLVIAFFSFSLVSQALEAYGLLFVRLRQLPVLYLKINICKLALQLSLNVYFIVFLEMGVLGVAIAQFIAFALVALYFAQHIFARTGMRFSISFSKRLIVFSWPLWLAGLMNIYISSADKFFVRYLDSLTSVGLLGLAQQFAAVLPALVWQPFMQYWATERFEIYHRKTGYEVYNWMFIGATTLIVTAAAALSIFAPAVIAVMADQSFHDAYKAVTFLCIAAVFQCVTGYCNLGIMVSESTIWIARATFVTAIVSSVLFLAMIPSFGFQGAAAAYAMACGVQFAIIYSISRQHFDMHLVVWRFVAFGVAVFALCFQVNAAGIEMTVDQLAARLGSFVIVVVLALLFLMSEPELRLRVLGILRREQD